MARPLAMGLLSKKVPKAEDVYNAVKAGNIAEVTKLLGAGGSPEKHEDAFVRCTHRSSAQLITSARAQPPPRHACALGRRLPMCACTSRQTKGGQRS